MIDNILSLVSILKKAERVFIQTHNFPDFDAVASAFAMQCLLKKCDVSATIIYDGDIQRDSLRRMIDKLNIHIFNCSLYDLQEDDCIIFVDCNTGQSNVTALPGKKVAVIDHHVTEASKEINFVDIRSDYGACATIIYTYLKDMGYELTKEIASALLIGINMDTAALTRNVTEIDLEAYQELYFLTDKNFVNDVVLHYLNVPDLPYFKTAMEKVRIDDGLAFCFFADGCPQNLLGILGDFFLSLAEIKFVVLCAKNNNKIQFSIRNEREDLSSVDILKKVLKDIGFGGGHFNMAGGIITNLDFFKEEEIHRKFLNEVKKK
ncbi:recombinase RecJ [bacterium]|nr:recombinase RecJ [bacterium]MBT3581693.1 recombinase RecJ [bacterium]MBT4552887.1 recombinase RecJ [bacterium]MBT7088329.1 recombinase RecJ [bacterium]